MVYVPDCPVCSVIISLPYMVMSAVFLSGCIGLLSCLLCVLSVLNLVIGVWLNCNKISAMNRAAACVSACAVTGALHSLECHGKDLRNLMCTCTCAHSINKSILK